MKIVFTDFEIMSASMGNDNILPDIHNNKYIRSSVNVSDKLSEEDKKFVGYGMISTLLPYKVQDDYTRSREIKKYKCAILENEYLKAIFVTELGGRLWSLYDKKNEKELLYRNDVFQPANLALRNAWFSGGIEWNVGIKGHTPLTVSPLFAQKVYSQNGNEILKMYEYERIRGIVYSIYATLKDDVLLVKVCIENSKDSDVPMYWWSNIALPEDRNIRVITPAEEMFYCAYEKDGYVLSKTKLPYLEERDITFANTSNRSRDYFFKIPDEENKWMAGIGENGYGLIEFSTINLKGRKLFVWGNGIGGRHWNAWLTGKSKNYIEVQAGLLRTQLEHFPMEKNSEISFIEGFSPITTNSESISGDFYDASNNVRTKVADKYKYLDESTFKISKKDEIVYYGSGWGALQNKIDKNVISKHCTFPDDSMTIEQKEWFDLTKDIPLSSDGKEDIIYSYVSGEYWKNKLEKTMKGNWYEYLQLGILKYEEGDFCGSKSCFEKSISIHPNAWAYRNLAQIKGNIEKDIISASTDMEKAADLKNDYIPLLIETATALMRCEKYEKWIDRYNSSPVNVKNNGRIKMLTGACYAFLGETDKAKEFINEKLVVNDIMEGEYSLSEIWHELYSRVLAKERKVNPSTLSKEEVLKSYPIPFELDFRMH